MSNRFFTSIECLGNTILHRYVEDGIRKQEKITDFKPVVFIQNNSGVDSGFKDLYGQSVVPKYFDNISSARSYIKDYGSLEGAKLYGITKWDLQFASNEYPDDIVYDSSLIRKCIFDIECLRDPIHGFAKPTEADAPIQLITVYDSFTEKYYMFGERPYTPDSSDTLYMCEPDEKLRLTKFIAFWEQMSFDIVSGYNSKTFDMVYLYTRLIKLFGEEFANRLSPWKKCRYVNQDSESKDVEVEVTGLSQLDYLELYKKYNPGGKESFTLDFIAEYELGANKVDYEEYGSLWNLMNQNFELFAKYNKIDVELVKRLNDKQKAIEIQIQLAYNGKINFDAAFSAMALWTAIVYNYAIKQNIIMPPHEHSSKSEQFEGAYVKDPKVGMHKWSVTYDFTSLYPTVMASFNISPETLIRSPVDVPPLLLDMWGKDISETMLESGAIPPEITQCLKDNNLILSGNGQLYRSDISGILPILIRKMFAERKAAKTKMLSMQTELELKKAKLEKLKGSK